MSELISPRLSMIKVCGRSLVHSPGKVQVGLPGHGDVGEVLLQDEDVPAHLLDAGLADPLEVLGPVDQNAGDEVA